MLTSIPIPSACLRKEAVVFGGLLIIVMPILGLHIDLDKLENEATP
jgi:hypothetical protein